MPKPKNPDEPVYIYVLLDPRDGKPFYVGQSNNPYKRYLLHRSEARNSRTNTHQNAKERQLCAILDAGLQAILVTIQTTDHKESDQWEAMWIDRLQADGYELTNMWAMRAGQLPKRKGMGKRGYDMHYFEDDGSLAQTTARVYWAEERNGEVWYELTTALNERIWRTEGSCENARQLYYEITYRRKPA